MSDLRDNSRFAYLLLGLLDIYYVRIYTQNTEYAWIQSDSAYKQTPSFTLEYLKKKTQKI
jgi:hypothetical protein